MPNVLADRDSRNRIIFGTLGLAVTGGAVGMNIAILRNLQPIARHATTMAMNWSLYGVLFFTAREIMLVEQKSKNEPLNLRFSQTRDNDELFSSAIAGGLTGGVLALITRGRRSVPTGVGLFAAISGVGQYCYTCLNRRRQEIILQSKYSDSQESTTSLAIAAAEETEAEAEAEAEEDIDKEAEEESQSIIARMRRALSTDPIERLPSWFPIRRIQSDEYRQMLVTRREEIELELSQIRRMVASMDRREELLLQQLRRVESSDK
ncbi:hypothetical protein FBU59_005731 [Linderina macrospora]|uniref:Uncharacterized protein n=1 Tax=Linderina macrospora TaxID=4868 RepID=A0ACC1J250_9FUNG|nr:hypothetical protein FBU59_005731 [Linderina macrospora]